MMHRIYTAAKGVGLLPSSFSVPVRGERRAGVGCLGRGSFCGDVLARCGV